MPATPSQIKPAVAIPADPLSESMNIVIGGHVDHGKSTVVGRLLADTGSLPEGKLEQVKALCERTARPFEYAFLLDALKDEQAQGITIDSARVFFKSDKRHYIIIDAPGHIEFLKNMVTGASRASAALLVIDAKEGVQENSRRTSGSSRSWRVPNPPGITSRWIGKTINLNISAKSSVNGFDASTCTADSSSGAVSNKTKAAAVNAARM